MKTEFWLTVKQIAEKYPLDGYTEERMIHKWDGLLRRWRLSDPPLLMAGRDYAKQSQEQGVNLLVNIYREASLLPLVAKDADRRPFAYRLHRRYGIPSLQKRECEEGISARTERILRSLEPAAPGGKRRES